IERPTSASIFGFVERATQSKPSKQRRWFTWGSFCSASELYPYFKDLLAFASRSGSFAVPKPRPVSIHVGADCIESLRGRSSRGAGPVRGRDDRQATGTTSLTAGRFSL